MSYANPNDAVTYQVANLTLVDVPVPKAGIVNDGRGALVKDAVTLNFGSTIVTNEYKLSKQEFMVGFLVGYDEGYKDGKAPV